MATVYGGIGGKLKPATLPDNALIAIGKLTRAFAEIDDLLDLCIAKMGGTTEGVAAILMGRLAISAKIKTGQYLAQLHGGLVQQSYEKIFDGIFSETLRARNAVAHGALLGQDVEGRFSFLTDSSLSPTEQKLTREVVGFTAEDLEEYAVQAEHYVTAIEIIFGIAASRKKRLEQALRPHRKARQKQSQSDKPKGQHGSSQVKRQKLSARQRRELMTARAKKK